MRRCGRNEVRRPRFHGQQPTGDRIMEYMGFILFLWIIGGACVAMFVADRVASSNRSTLVDAAVRPGHAATSAPRS
jgi:hypothetical protein